ncbi:uncharacterized protein Tco025E_09661 [Trypanosoma conorhini]|uniref:Uncharacterized protein n=1 Tax=Trypanosoma conorhini TaxID=83891 RepID=A0A3R7KAE4_9TRYP|nr:uncharacterized protein Tco025E_09661 [Trypanosoma conorhini]RNE96758.1 hypothetical protein Tco025E_09661 [Trypanosoma conorhini]
MQCAALDNVINIVTGVSQMHSPSCIQQKAAVPHSPSNARSNSRDTRLRRVPSPCPSSCFKSALCLDAPELLPGREVSGVFFAGDCSVPLVGTGPLPEPAAAFGAVSLARGAGISLPLASSGPTPGAPMSAPLTGDTASGGALLPVLPSCAAPSPRPWRAASTSLGCIAGSGPFPPPLWVSLRPSAF